MTFAACLPIIPAVYLLRHSGILATSAQPRRISVAMNRRGGRTAAAASPACFHRADDGGLCILTSNNEELFVVAR